MNLLDTASLVVTPNAYKTSKLYSIVPTDGSGDLTFSRTGDTATRVNSAGLIETVLANRPRLDYLGSSCPRLLVEPQRTNLSNYSSEFDNGAWTKTRVSITANSIVSPDGTTTADKLVEDTTATNEHTFSRNITLIDSTIYTISIFAKKGERNWIFLRDGTAANRCSFDLNNGVIGTLVGTGASAKIEAYQNGWYRCSLTFTQSGTVGRIQYLLATGTNTLSYTGDGTSGLYVWGAQVEQGSFSTSYIPTTTATVTRNADSCTKTSISSLLGQTEGVIFFDVNLNSRLASTYFIIKGTSGNDINILINNTSIVGNVNNGGVAQAAITHTNSTTGRFKIALAYKLNDIVMYVNGVQIGTDSSATIPATTEIDLFNGATNSIGYNSASIWKTRLTNQELATLTTI